MDSWEVGKVVFERLHALDPENASKIMGMLLIHDHSEKELIRLAFGPDHLLHSFVASARAELAANAKPSLPPPSSPAFGPSQAGSPWGAPSPGGEQTGCDALYPEDYDCWSPPASGAHRRSFSLSDAEVGGWRPPCMYYARGFCKNGSSCRFLHGVPEEDAAAGAERGVAVMQRAKTMAARPPQLVEPAFPFSSSPEGLSFILQQQQQQQSESQRLATAMLLGGEQDLSRFSVPSPRLDRGDLMNSPAALQIYLTFPADSTFTEEDVSSYFSTFGPVQDVRIPYQQKRMFGFVTFVYPETVRIILSKGNPHFVRDARVLVKPYKEKGKVHDRFRKLQQAPHHGEFPGCITPTRLLDPRDPFDLQQPQIGPRMVCGDIANQEAFLRRRLQEQQQADELQQAIDLQSRRFMGLQLLDLKRRRHHLGSPAVDSSMYLGQQAGGKGIVNGNGNVFHLEDVTIPGADYNLNSSSIAMSAPAFSAVSETAAEGKREEQKKEEDGDGTPKQAVNPGEEQRESGPVTAAPNVACGFKESGVDHNLPGSLSASPTKVKAPTDSNGATAQDGSINPQHAASSLLPPTSSVELPPYNSCFFQAPRFTSGHETIGL